MVNENHIFNTVENRLGSWLFAMNDQSCESRPSQHIRLVSYSHPLAQTIKYQLTIPCLTISLYTFSFLYFLHLITVKPQ